MSGQQGDFEFFTPAQAEKVKETAEYSEAENSAAAVFDAGAVDAPQTGETAVPEAAPALPETPELSPRTVDADLIASCGASYGEVLRRLRESRGIEIEDLSAETCIKPEALRALEAEDTSALPPPFFIAAYIKKLCQLYGVSDKCMQELTSEVRGKLERTVPEDLSKVVRGHEVSEENERRIRRLAVILVGLGVAIAVVLISGAVLLVSHLAGGTRTDRNVQIVINENDLIKLQDAPKLEIPRLPKTKN